MTRRIAIDAHMVGTGETGNETYVRGLVGGLRELGAGHEYLLYTPDPALLPQALLGGGVRARRVVPGDNLRRVGWAMPRAARQDRLDLLHATYTLPPWLYCPAVVTVHDISYRTHPETFSARDRLLLSLAVPISMRRAARVITVSEAARRDIIRHYRVPAAKVVAIHNGVEPGFRPVVDPAALAAVRARYGLPERYILAVGNLQPRKNVRRLIEAFAALRAARGDDCRLVLVGQPFWRHEELGRVIAARGLGEVVVATGYVPAGDLPAIYSAATVFAYPSLYEGFGLPPLEAMACGTPVVAGNTSALPEVVGEAGLLVDPLDAGAIAAALGRLWDDAALRERLRRAGFARAAGFTWREAARRTLGVYEAAMGGK
ncbi:MAG: glycosyltransferase family 1 protein [Chloroflexia bacterium]